MMDGRCMMVPRLLVRLELCHSTCVMCMNMCIDMCTDMWIDMCISVSLVRCAYRCRAETSESPVPRVFDRRPRSLGLVPRHIPSTVPQPRPRRLSEGSSNRRHRVFRFYKQNQPPRQASHPTKTKEPTQYTTTKTTNTATS